MRKLLNTLYITTPEAYLSKDGLNVVVSVDKEERFRIPIMNVESIVTFGYMGASPGLMKLCMDNNVALSDTTTKAGEKRLRKVAKECVNFGQRVQNSVFECLLTEAQLVNLKSILSAIINDTTDSIRIYHLGSNWQRKIETLGKVTSFDPTDTLIV